MTTLELIRPDWPAPDNIRAAVTTRLGGVSVPPFDGLNLGLRTGDAAAAVDENRRRLAAALDLPEPPRWLRQVHGTTAAYAGHVERDRTEADAAWTDRPGQVCVVQSADCLPVLFCGRDGRSVAVAHAGWRGLAAGVLERTAETLRQPGERLLAWLGPAIGADTFEVGAEVRQAFLDADPGAGAAFRPSPTGRWMADLYELARRRLRAVGVGWIGGGGFCTFTDQWRFYSYRRDRETGRMASLIWLDS